MVYQMMPDEDVRNGRKVRCPVCDAPTGAMCRDRGKEVGSFVHVARLDEYEKQAGL